MVVLSICGTLLYDFLVVGLEYVFVFGYGPVVDFVYGVSFEVFDFEEVFGVFVVLDAVVAEESEIFFAVLGHA